MHRATSPPTHYGAEHRVRPEPTDIVDRTKLLDQSDTDATDVLYWPSVVPVHAIDAVSAPLGDYHLYYSASHAESAMSADGHLGGGRIVCPNTAIQEASVR